MFTLIDLHQVDTFGLYVLQINADTETRSGYIYSTDQCGYRDKSDMLYPDTMRIQCGYTQL